MARVKLALAIDANNPVIGDIYLGTNRKPQVTSTLREEVAQLLYTRYRFFQGEWFLDRRLGVPYYQSILGMKVSNAIVTRILRAVAETCPGVASVDTFSVVPQVGRAAVCNFSLTLDDGSTLTSADFDEPFIVGS
jgi:hypothetical protein